MRTPGSSVRRKRNKQDDVDQDRRGVQRDRCELREEGRSGRHRRNRTDEQVVGEAVLEEQKESESEEHCKRSS